ncbi:hypothetical protein DSECCO2_405420 [anaerobic digester metagenome]
MVQGALHGQAQVLEVQGLGQVVVGPGLDGLHRRLHVGIGRHDQDGDGRVVGLDLLQGLDAGDAGHPHVHEDEVEGLLPAARHGRLAVGGRLDAETPVRQQGRQHAPVAGIVVDNENGDAGGLHAGLLVMGSSMVKTVPRPTALSTLMAAP